MKLQLAILLLTSIALADPLPPIAPQGHMAPVGHSSLGKAPEQRGTLSGMISEKRPDGWFFILRKWRAQYWDYDERVYGFIKLDPKLPKWFLADAFIGTYVLTNEGKEMVAGFRPVCVWELAK